MVVSFLGAVLRHTKVQLIVLSVEMTAVDSVWTTADGLPPQFSNFYIEIADHTAPSTVSVSSCRFHGQVDAPKNTSLHTPVSLVQAQRLSAYRATRMALYKSFIIIVVVKMHGFVLHTIIYIFGIDAQKDFIVAFPEFSQG